MTSKPWGLPSSAAALVVPCWIALHAATAAANPTPSLPAPSLSTIDAARVILLDVGRTADALVAVGERGTVLRSEDGGADWSPMPGVTDRALTAVAFSKGGNGVAVGHGGVILRTDDGGRSWARVTVDLSLEDSLLGVTVLAPGRFVAYGAFGLYLESTDGGRSWERRRVLEEDFDRHIYRVTVMGDGRLLLVGESGTLALGSLASDGPGDGVTSWARPDSPYEGSFFGAVATKGGTVLAYGMRGHVFRSDDFGATWTAAETGTTAAFFNGTVTPKGAVVLVGNDGTVSRSDDDGRSFHTIGIGNAGLAALTVDPADGALTLVGGAGVVRYPSLDALPWNAEPDNDQASDKRP